MTVGVYTNARPHNVFGRIDIGCRVAICVGSFLRPAHFSAVGLNISASALAISAGTHPRLSVMMVITVRNAASPKAIPGTASASCRCSPGTLAVDASCTRLNGPIAHSCRPRCWFKPPSVRLPAGFPCVPPDQFRLALQGRVLRGTKPPQVQCCLPLPSAMNVRTGTGRHIKQGALSSKPPIRSFFPASNQLMLSSSQTAATTGCTCLKRETHPACYLAKASAPSSSSMQRSPPSIPKVGASLLILSIFRSWHAIPRRPTTA